MCWSSSSPVTWPVGRTKLFLIMARVVSGLVHTALVSGDGDRLEQVNSELTGN